MHRPRAGGPRPYLATFALLVAVAACSPSPTPAPGTPGPAASPSPTGAVVATQAPTASPAPTDAGVAADLDGVLTDAALAHRLPLAVSIDDAAAARPQAGFNAASIVIQAPADGYESRYLMIFQEADASAIGPVRSARIFLAQWASEYAAAFAHYGGDRLTRAWMAANRGTLFTDVDGLGAGNPAYHRTSDRSAPHNAYGSTATLSAQAAKLGAEVTIADRVHRRPFRDDLPLAQRGLSQTITIPYHTVTVSYAYDPDADRYLRSLDGKPHVDALDGQQVTARTVVVLYMNFRTDNTIEPGHNRPVLGFTGSGTATVFSEGTAIEATWSKKGESDPTLILAKDGSELAFVRGRIFFQVVPTGTKVVVAR